MKLLPIFYLPPISWWAEFLTTDDSIIFEQFENFPKQTYRNRANIYGANGKLSLIIPIKHTGLRTIKNIQISYSENWQTLHWKSIKTAYQSSPYFEYYEHQLQEIFKTSEKQLILFNLRTIDIIRKILKTEKAYSLNEEYLKNPEGQNLRDSFSAKKDTDYLMECYYQTFSEKYGFIEDLSILDLICNKGPESMTYINSVKKRQNNIF